MSKSARNAPAEHPRAIPRTGEDLARAARLIKTSTATSGGQPPAEREEVKPVAMGSVYVGVGGVPDDEPTIPPGAIVTQVPWQ